MSGDPLLQQSGVSSDELSQILASVAGSDITELDITVGPTRLSLRRPARVGLGVDAERVVVQSAEAPSFVAISSPLVGIFRPSVQAGDSIRSGQPIGAIEALGMPTNVDSPENGIIEELLVADRSPVEYGQPLVNLRRSFEEPGADPGSSDALGG